MKLNELVNFYKTASQEMLEEHIAKNNDTGLLAEDAAKIIRAAHDTSSWSEPMSGDELMERLRRIAEGAKNGKR